MVDELDIEGQVTRVLNEIVKTRERFKNGVQRILGISPFVSKNLAQEYDHLADRYFNLLVSALSHKPGVAVIEVREARAISQELNLTGKELTRRITPVLVSGYYRVQHKDQASSVSFDIRVQTSDGKVNKVEKNVEDSKIGVFLAKQILGKLLTISNDDTEITPAEQSTWLTIRAEEFSKLAQSKRAIGLREAALLLTPQDVKQRLAVLGDYREINAHRSTLPAEAIQPPRPPLFTKVVNRHVGYYMAALEHVEFLILNRLVSRNTAASLIATYRAIGLLHLFPYMAARDKEGKNYRLGKDVLRRAEDAELAFHKHVLPIFPELPVSTNSSGIALGNFNRYLMNSYLRRIDESSVSPVHFHDCLVYFNQWMPDDLLTSSELKYFFGYGRRNVSDKEWTTFLTKLADSDKILTRALAEYGFVYIEIMQMDKTDEAGKNRLARRIQSLMDYWRDIPLNPRYTSTPRNKEPIYNDLTLALKKLHPKPIPAPKPIKSLHVRPDDWETNPATWESWGYPESTRRIMFAPLQIRMFGSDANNALPWRGLRYVKGNSEFDWLWGSNGVYRLEDNGIAHRIYDGMSGPVGALEWDGQFLWIILGTNYGGQRSLLILDQNGKRKAMLASKDRHPHDTGLRMKVIEKGRACLAGTFRPYNRTWLAMVTVNEQGAKLEIFHEAKSVPTTKKGRKHFGDPNLVFLPTWMHVMDMGEKHTDVLLIGRDRTTNHEKFHPLTVDVNTLAVSVSPMEISPQAKDDNAFFSLNGELMHDTRSLVMHFSRIGKNWNNGEPWKKRCTNINDAGMLGNGFVRVGDELHVMGSKWFRINLRTMEEEEITVGTIPIKKRMAWYGYSDNYGLLGYNRSFYTISFAKKNKDID